MSLADPRQSDPRAFAKMGSRGIPGRLDACWNPLDSPRLGVGGCISPQIRVSGNDGVTQRTMREILRVAGR